MRDNPYNLEIKLKQHTPIIHFHAQQQMGLRASEVKPKLDKLIVWNEFDNDFDKAKWFLKGFNKSEPESLRDQFSKGYRALDYRLTISNENISVEEIQNITTKKYPPFFANMGDDYGVNQKKYFVFAKKVKLTYFSFNPDILELIPPYLGIFFARNNFGTRQTKGFGSYFIHPREELYDDFFDVLNQDSLTYFDVHQNNSDSLYKSHSNLFGEIDLLYKALRSGINHRIYFKSLLWTYFLYQTRNKDQTKSFWWEKRKFKEKFYSNKRKDQEIRNAANKDDPIAQNNNNRSEYLIKDLMGLSTSEEWKGKDYNDDTLTKTDTENVITRFKSPFLFKPLRIDNNRFRVYLNYSSLPSEYLGSEFQISSSNKKDSFNMRLPKSFNPESFLKFICFNWNIWDHVDMDYQNESDFEKLERVFDEINDNRNF